MNNADRIRHMTDEELASFIFKWQVNLVSEVVQNGFVNVLNFKDMKDWLAEEGKPHERFEVWEDDAE